MNKADLKNSNLKDRAERFVSHALVEVRRYKMLPFKAYSGVLLDMSMTGLKLEFTSEVRVQPGEKYWLIIPLTPLGIAVSRRLMCRIECRWFDESRFRIGGIFVDLTASERNLLEQIIETLRSAGRL